MKTEVMGFTATLMTPRLLVCCMAGESCDLVVPFAIGWCPLLSGFDFHCMSRQRAYS